MNTAEWKHLEKVVVNLYQLPNGQVAVQYGDGARYISIENLQIVSELFSEAINIRAEEIDRLKSMPYREYLSTDHWKKTSQDMRNKHKSCQLCGSKKKLEVHHNTYENRGNEKAEDLIVLCRSCHGGFHKKSKCK